MNRLLLYAGAFHIIAAIFVMLAMSEDESAAFFSLWSGLTFAMGVFLVAAFHHPDQHWLFALFVFGAKLAAISVILGSGMYSAGQLSGVVLVHEVFWLGPLGVVLYHVFRDRSDPSYRSDSSGSFDIYISGLSARKQLNRLKEISHESPVLAVFLRHFGCTFCRAALAQVARMRKEVEREGVRVILIHMGNKRQADQILSRYGLEDVERIADGRCELYRIFGLRRGSFSQLFGLRVLAATFYQGLIGGHGMGRVYGDGFQMPGVFLLSRGRVVKEFRPKTVDQTIGLQEFAKLEQ